MNRIYAPDPEWNPKIAILYVKPGTTLHVQPYPDLFDVVQARNGRNDMTTRSFHLRPHIFRTELVSYLYECGYSQPLIIDSSCGGLYSNDFSPSDQDLRRMKRGKYGGTKKKRKTRKRKTIKNYK